MHVLWIAYFGLIAAFSLIGSALCALGLRHLPWLNQVDAARSDHAPFISIIFAARDEAEKLPAALPTLLAQDYLDYEVVAVNDRSRDATPDILNQFARASKRLRVCNVAELPPGWLGKPHALQRGCEQAAGSWIVFTDADVHFAPAVLRRVLSLVRKQQIDHL